MTDLAPSAKLQHNRQREIYLLALKEGSVEVADLARRFDVTTETIRRDLSDLQDRKRLRRVHGGAVPYERLHHEPMVEARGALNSQQKQRIAREAITLLPKQGSVIIDSGSTLQHLAEVFPPDTQLHVVTNSLASGLILARLGLANLTVLGGGVRTNTFAMVDGYTVDAVRELQVDMLLISCDGLTFQRGLTTPYREESLVKRAMIESARTVVACVDFSKIGNGQMFSYAELDEIDVLITDDRIDKESVEVLSGHDIDVRVV